MKSGVRMMVGEQGVGGALEREEERRDDDEMGAGR